MTSNTVNQLQTWSNLYLIGTQNKQTFIYYDIVSIYKMKDKTLFENFTVIPLALYIYIYIYIYICVCVYVCIITVCEKCSNVDLLSSQDCNHRMVLNLNRCVAC